MSQTWSPGVRGQGLEDACRRLEGKMLESLAPETEHQRVEVTYSGDDASNDAEDESTVHFMQPRAFVQVSDDLFIIP